MTAVPIPTPITLGDDQSEEAIGVSPGFRIGDVVLVSGQAASDADGNLVGGDDFEAQGHQVFSNLKRVLEAGGSSLDDVVKVTIFVTDMSHYETVVVLRRQYFSAPYPADSIVEVTALPGSGRMMEIDAIALACDGKGNK